MTKEKMYSLAIRKRANKNDYFWQNDNYTFIEVDINTNGKYWLADPFLFEKDGNIYIFYEAFDLVARKGMLGYSIYNPLNNTATHPHIIIDEFFHLSFPNIFEYAGDIYIMPESCEDYTLHVYKATSFPDKWERVYDILPDVYACDSIFISKENKQYLLTNELYHHTPTGTYPSCWVKNFLYPLNGLKIQGDGIKAGDGEFGIRNAGKSFEIDGTLYRIGQDCRNRMYGCGLVLFEVTSLIPYNESLKLNLTYKDFATKIERRDKSELIGVHTYNFCEHYEIIDFSQMKELSLKILISRFYFRFKRLMRRLSKL